MLDQSPQYTVSLDKVTSLRDAIADLFTVTATALDSPEAGHIRFRGYPNGDLATDFDELRRRFERFGFTPFVRNDEASPTGVQMALIAVPVVFRSAPSNWQWNLVLFLATVLSTLFVGYLGYLSQQARPAFDAREIWRGWPFSLSLLLILGAHELGHYFAARYHKVPVTLPYFIPLPVSLVGTLGAFIRLKAPVKNRRALFDVGAAGPLAGLVFAVPILLIGLATSPVQVPEPGGLLEGNSILYALAKIAVIGEFVPNRLGQDVLLNNVAWAGWVGLFVTGLNLIPVGQLDGGHIMYVLFGRRARNLYWPVLIGLAALAVIFPGSAVQWGIWLVLIFFFGRAYAVPLDDVTPLDPRRRALAILCLVIFFLVFVPIPLQATG